MVSTELLSYSTAIKSMEQNMAYPRFIDIEREAGLPDLLKLPSGMNIFAERIDGNIQYSAYKNNEKIYDSYSTLAGIITAIQEYGFAVTEHNLKKEDIWPKPDLLKNQVIGVDHRLNYLIGKLYDALPSKAGSDLMDQVRFSLVISGMRDLAEKLIDQDLVYQRDSVIYEYVGDLGNLEEPPCKSYNNGIIYLMKHDYITLDDDNNIAPSTESYELLDKKCLQVIMDLDKKPTDIDVPKAFVSELYEGFPMNMSIGYTPEYQGVTGEKRNSELKTFYVYNLSKGIVAKDIPTYEEAMKVAKEKAPEHVPYRLYDARQNKGLDQTIPTDRPYNSKERADSNRPIPNNGIYER